jgi:hypothetical protein
MPGNLLGNRAWYLYTADNGNQYSYLTDQDLATAVGATLNDENQTLPRGLRPRGVNCQDADGNKKFVIVPSTTSTVWTADGSSTLSIDNKNFTVTSKRGERVRIPNNPEAPAAP